jgi:hypothetical protein
MTNFLTDITATVNGFYALRAKCFTIKPPIYLTPTTPLDHLGVGIFCDEQHIYM